MRIIDRIVSPLGRRVDESSPMVDARLPDGSRVNVIIPPLSLVGPCISIRKFSRAAYSVDDLIRLDTPHQGHGRLPAGLRAGPAEHRRLRRHLHRQDHAAQHPVQLPARTTSASSPSRTAAELQLQQEHVVRLEARPPNVEGKGAGDHPPARDQRAAHAPRPHRRGRGARRRGAGHAPGHEHRPRRLADHGALQHARATRCTAWRRWC